MRKWVKAVPLLVISASSFAVAASAQDQPAVSQNSGAIGYADLADLALAAPIAAVVTVHDTIRLKGADAAGVAPGFARLYVDGDVNTLIAGAGGLPASVSWLVDVPLDSSNHPPRLKKQRLILLARRRPPRPGPRVQGGPPAPRGWTPAQPIARAR